MAENPEGRKNALDIASEPSFPSFGKRDNQAYKLDVVPYPLLLDLQGKIIDMELRGSALDVVLIDLYGDKFKD